MIKPPDDTPEYAYPMWVAALKAAVTNDGALKAFREDTGKTYIYSPPKTPMEALIDQATGRDREFAHAFAAWFNEKVWGPWDEA